MENVVGTKIKTREKNVRACPVRTTSKLNKLTRLKDQPIYGHHRARELDLETS